MILVGRSTDTDSGRGSVMILQNEGIDLWCSIIIEGGPFIDW